MTGEEQTGREHGSVIVDHQAHWYPRSCVEALIGRSDYPKVVRGTDAGTSSWPTTASPSPQWAP